MDYTKIVACPVCGRTNKVPENLESLVKTFIVRGDNNDQNKMILSGILDELTESVRSNLLNFLQKRKQGDPNNWIDIECVNKRAPYGKHYFRYHLITREVSK